MVSEQLHYTTNREEIFIFSNKKMSYLCGVWRFANAYYSKDDKERLIAYMRKLNVAVAKVVDIVGNQ